MYTVSSTWADQNGQKSHFYQGENFEGQRTKKPNKPNQNPTLPTGPSKPTQNKVTASKRKILICSGLLAETVFL